MWVHRRTNRFHEGLILALVTVVLLRPDFFNRLFGLGVAGWYVVGLAAFGLVLFLQRKPGKI